APICPCVKLPECDLLIIKSGATTVREAVAMFPAPPSAELRALVALVRFPVVTPVTLTAKLHPSLVPSVAPERLMLFEPAAAVLLPPPPEPVKPFGVDTTNPAGSGSLKATPVSAAAVFGFERL